MKLTLLFPAYNESAAITGVLEDFAAVCEAQRIASELIVVNDGSTDATSQEVRRYMVRNQNVRLIEHPRNLGYGAALRSGFLAASGDYVFFTDSDGQFRADELDRTLAARGPKTIVLGYRLDRAEGLNRRMNAWLWGGIIRRSLGFNVRDLNCAWKLFPRDLIAPAEYESRGAFISAELLFYAHRRGYAFIELPVRHWPRRTGRSTGAQPRVIARALLEYVKFLRRRSR